MQLKIPEMLLLLGMGAAFSQFANMLVGILQSVLNYQEISGIYGPADGRKTNVVPDLIYGNHSTACRGNRFSLADLSETSDICEWEQLL